MVILNHVSGQQTRTYSDRNDMERLSLTAEKIFSAYASVYPNAALGATNTGIKTWMAPLTNLPLNANVCPGSETVKIVQQ